MEFNEIQSKLLATDVSSKVEKKGNLSYLSWAYAWAEVIKVDPTANYEVERFDNLPYVKTEEGYMVYTSVTIGGVTRKMWLPVMDSRNKALTSANMFDINKTIMRCLVKNIAMFGLGINVYIGEDVSQQSIVDESSTIEARKVIHCSHCGREVMAHGKMSAEDFAKGTYNAYGEILCYDCASKAKAEKDKQAQKDTKQGE
jgi:hypothetical protein